MELTDKLIYIFQLVNDWLKFAESKNTALLAFCGVMITANVTYLSAAKNIPSSLQIGLLLASISLGLSSVISFLSFFPKLDIKHYSLLKKKLDDKFKPQTEDTDNFYFFDHLKKYRPTDLLKSIDKLYFGNKLKKPYSKECEDLAGQITINSKIASTKFQLFKASLWFLILSIFITPISLILSLLIYGKL